MEANIMDIDERIQRILNKKIGSETITPIVLPLTYSYDSPREELVYSNIREWPSIYIVEHESCHNLNDIYNYNNDIFVIPIDKIYASILNYNTSDDETLSTLDNPEKRDSTKANKIADNIISTYKSWYALDFDLKDSRYSEDNDIYLTNMDYFSEEEIFYRITQMDNNKKNHFNFSQKGKEKYKSEDNRYIYLHLIHLHNVYLTLLTKGKVDFISSDLNNLMEYIPF